MAIKTQGTVLKRNGVTVPKVFDIAGPNGSANEIDVTTFESPAKEFILGLKDQGDITISMVYDTSSAAQNAVRDDFDTGNSQTYSFTLNDGLSTTGTFTAYVKSFALQIGADDKVVANATLRVSGAIVYT